VISLATALSWLWLGMVLSISFIEAPLKFRVVDLRTGLAIGRVVFRALNGVEAVLAVLLGVALLVGDPGGTAVVAGAGAIAVLVAQVVGVRPALSRRSDRVLAGENGPRSRAHLWYVGLELVKVAALLVAGVALL
jgi:hypothetical protein